MGKLPRPRLSNGQLLFCDTICDSLGPGRGGADCRCEVHQVFLNTKSSAASSRLPLFFFSCVYVPCLPRIGAPEPEQPGCRSERECIGGRGGGGEIDAVESKVSPKRQESVGSVIVVGGGSPATVRYNTHRAVLRRTPSLRLRRGHKGSSAWRRCSEQQQLGDATCPRGQRGSLPRYRPGPAPCPPRTTHILRPTKALQPSLRPTSLRAHQPGGRAGQVGVGRGLAHSTADATDLPSFLVLLSNL